MVDISRVQKELTECNRDREVSSVSITLHDGANVSHLIGTITGPADSPNEGGTFVIDIRLPGGYPFEPPKMQFVTKVCTYETIQHLLLRLDTGQRPSQRVRQLAWKRSTCETIQHLLLQLATGQRPSQRVRKLAWKIRSWLRWAFQRIW